MKIVVRGIAVAMCLSLTAQVLPIRSEARKLSAQATMTYNPFRGIQAQRLTLADGRKVFIDRTGVASVTSADHRTLAERIIPGNLIPRAGKGTEEYDAQLHQLANFIDLFQSDPRRPYAQNTVLVVLNDGVSPAADSLKVPAATMRLLHRARTTSERQQSMPRYTNDLNVNTAFADAGVSQLDRMFAGFDRGRLSSMSSLARTRSPRSLNIANVYRATLTSSSVENAVAQLQKVSGVAYAGPDWAVTPMHAPLVPLPRAETSAMTRVNRSDLRRTMLAMPSAIPENYAVLSSAQSLLNSSGLDVIAAHDEIVNAFHQLPGAGEIITNISIGDISAAEDAGGDPDSYCNRILKDVGPMTTMINGQRYIDYPGMPLIPAYAADTRGLIDPKYTACAEGPPDEYALDFSMMAPLPDSAQRPSRPGSLAAADLLGIAPGASYRLVVPATNAVSGPGTFESNFTGTLLAAATQTPKPDVITVSLGFGYDAFGFPGRYLEDDPIVQSLVAAVVNSQNIVVCISANDGLRAYGPTSVPLYGGAAPTNLASNAQDITQLSDVIFSTTPSQVQDSGAIDVGGTTLNDIFSRPPNDPRYASTINQLAYPETRYNGMKGLASGLGSRVNVSAPADNVLAEVRAHHYCPDALCADVVISGGTSASAPEVAAVAAVALQLGRLTGHRLADARSVRDLLVRTATPVLQPAQADAPLNVGPQVNVRNLVEQMLSAANLRPPPALRRIGIAQRRPLLDDSPDANIFVTGTDPAYVNLAGLDHHLGDPPDGATLDAPITIAPDWESMPAGATYSLTLQGQPDRPLAVTPFARLYPAQILGAAFPGQPLASPANRTVHLLYRASAGKHMLAQMNFDLTFAPTDGMSNTAPAPLAPETVTTSSFTVSYDVSHMRHMENPVLFISEPGRFTPANRFIMHAAYSKALTGKTGSVTVNTGDLQGDGLYGIAIISTAAASQAQYASQFNTIHVQQAAASRPPAPLLREHGNQSANHHNVHIGLDGSVDVSWNVTSVPGTTGAMLEVSAPGPTNAYIINTFNNPNGSIRDDEGFNTGSTRFIALPSVAGTATFAVSDLGLQNGKIQQVRVLPMNGQAASGEASDVSSILTDGILPLGGGSLMQPFLPVQGGFAINPGGTDGILLPSVTEPGGLASEIESFDQNTHVVSKVAYSGFPGSFYAAGGALFADTALVGTSSSLTTQFGNLYAALPAFAAQAAPGSGTRISFSNPNDAIWKVSSSNQNGKSAALVYDATQSVDTASAQIVGIDMTGGSPAITGPFVTNADLFFLRSNMLFDADMNLGKAIVVRKSPSVWYDDGNPAAIDLVDMNTGTTQTINAVTAAVGPGMAIDDVTHKAVMYSTSEDALLMIDLSTGAQTKVPVPYYQLLASAGYAGGGGGLSALTPELMAADTVNHLFLMSAPYSVSMLNADYNSTGALYVYDENGNLLKTIHGLDSMGSTFLSQNSSYLQANGNTRTAFLLDGSQVQVFKY